MRITSKGQITIPQDIREQFGLLPNTKVRFIVKKGQIMLVKDEADATRGQTLLKSLTGKATVNMTTEEIMKLTRGDDDNKEK